jgi:hypothetical protein
MQKPPLAPIIYQPLLADDRGRFERLFKVLKDGLKTEGYAEIRVSFTTIRGGRVEVASAPPRDRAALR